MGDRHRKGQLKPIERFRNDIPPALLRLYKQMTVVDPNARLDSCEDVQSAIKAWRNQGRETIPNKPPREAEVEQPPPTTEVDVTPSRRKLLIDKAAGLTISVVRVPRGRFIAGASTEMIDVVSKSSSQGLSTKARDFLASSRHREVVVDEFWMSQVTVTNEMYACFLRATGDTPPRGWTTLTSLQSASSRRRRHARTGTCVLPLGECTTAFCRGMGEGCSLRRWEDLSVG